MRGKFLLLTVLVIAAGGFSWDCAAMAKQPGRNANTLDPSLANYEDGLAKYKRKDYDGAIDALLQAVYFARNSYQPDAYYYLGMAYKAKNQDAKAVEAFNKHLEQTIKPSPDGRVELGEVYMRNNRDVEAEREFKLALVDYMGQAPRAHNALGKLYDKKKDYDTAQWHYLQALGDPPWKYTEAWMNLTENMMVQQQWAQAIKHCQTMLSSDRTLKGVDEPRVALDLGVCKFAKGDHQGAMEAWQLAASLNPSFAAPHLLLAKMFESEKHISSAIKEYRTYIGLAADDKQLEQIKAHMSSLEQQISPAEAEVQPAKPSPYLRKQYEGQAASGSGEEQPDLEPVGKDSGF
jgi:tetratricopeptide (TPR) repeat protein